MSDGSWRGGDIEIGDADIRFVEDPLPPTRFLGTRSPDAAPDLAADLMASERIMQLVKDERFARDLYRAFCNTRWFRNGHEWGTTWRGAGSIVSDLRDLNEDYMDFYCSGNEGTVTDEVATELQALGWSWKPYD